MRFLADVATSAGARPVADGSWTPERARRRRPNGHRFEPLLPDILTALSGGTRLIEVE
jgi:hypothetical protein